MLKRSHAAKDHRIEETSPLQKLTGFTLIDMLLIIGVIADGIAMSLTDGTKPAKVAAIWSNIRIGLSGALGMFESDPGLCPTDEEGRWVLIVDPTIPGCAGPYLQRGLKMDPWRNDYAYYRDSPYPQRYILRRAGADEKFGTDDDLVQQDPLDTTGNMSTF